MDCPQIDLSGYVMIVISPVVFYFQTGKNTFVSSI